jgi:hypothetical protein
VQTLPHAAKDAVSTLKNYTSPAAAPASPSSSLIERAAGTTSSTPVSLGGASVTTWVATPPGLRARLLPLYFAPLPLSVVDPGFGGADCARKTCATDCGQPSGRGECDTTTGVCVCAPGFYWRVQGQDCAATLCPPDRDCSGHGFCVDNACRCLDGYAGPNCEAAAATLAPAAASFLEQASAAAALQAANTARAEAAARAEASRQALLAALHAAEMHEVSLAADALRADAAARAVLDASNESDPAIRKLYIDKLASRARAYKHVIAQHNSLLEAANGGGAGAGNVTDSGAAAPGAPSRPLDPATAASMKRFELETQAARAVATAVKRAASELASAGLGCPAECSHRGVCLNGVCQCKDSHGAYCEHLSCPEGCSGHGVCDPATGQCACADGFTGPSCTAADCVPRDCSGHGACERLERKDPAGAVIAAVPVCRCAPGWAGPRCDIPLCTKGCSNRGVCAEGGKCFCYPGFSGENCELGPTCAHECGIHGQCKAHVDGNKGAVVVACDCAEGWVGPQCAQRACKPEMEEFCGAHGVCADGKCLCEPGFEGERCDIRNDCSPPCEAAGGFCGAGANGKGQCICKPGFGGARCQGKVCSKTCHGRGACLDGQCQCEKGWTGADCEKGCPADCHGRGTCVPDIQGAPSCVCNAPFTGAACATGMCPGGDITAEGKQVICSSHGKCDTSTAECRCDLGYAAPACAVFSHAECSKQCRALCRDGEGGAFPVTNQLTGLEEVLTSTQCVRLCEDKCVLVDPANVAARAQAAAALASASAAAQAKKK